MLTLILLLALSASSVIGGDVKMNPCPAGTPGADKQGLIVELLQIEGCTAQPCVGEKGKNYTVETRAKFMYTAKKLHAKVIAIIPHFPEMTVYEDLDICSHLEPNACDNIKPEQTLQRKRSWKIEPYIPSGAGTMRLIISDDAGVAQFCGEINAVIKGTIMVPKFPLASG